MDTESFETKTKAAKAKGFQTWLNKEETRMLLSTVPEVGDNEVFLGLLRSAYNNGYSMGEATILVAILGEYMASHGKGTAQ
jgi:hypothetical protein